MNEETKDLEKQEQVELGNLNNLTQHEILDVNKKGKEKNPNILGIIIIILLVLAILGVGLYVAKDNGYLDKYINKQETNEDNNQEAKEDNNQEPESSKEEDDGYNTSDQKMLRTLNVLEYYSNEHIIGHLSHIYEKDATVLELDPSMKLISVLYYASFGDGYYSFEEIDKDKYPNVPEPKYEEQNVRIITSAKVKRLYKAVYGEELDVKTPIIEEAKSFLNYNEEYDIYVMYGGLGGACIPNTPTYLSSSDFQDEYIYLYSSFALATSEGIFKDFEKKEKYSDQTCSITINEDNYEDFHQYKITLNKDYTFSKIEKIK